MDFPSGPRAPSRVPILALNGTFAPKGARCFQIAVVPQKAIPFSSPPQAMNWRFAPSNTSPEPTNQKWTNTESGQRPAGREKRQ
jgi:hypothetical protein